MTKTQGAALYLIVLFLTADFAVKHIQPLIVLALNDNHYRAAARKCYEAQSNWELLEDASKQYEPEISRSLRESGMIGLMDCYRKEYLRRTMLAWGVGEHDLSRLELVARNESRTSLVHFAKGMAGGN